MNLIKKTPQIFVFLALGLILAPAFGSIPHSKTIATRVARNNGKGVYAIEQDVQLRTGADTVTLRERWIIENGDTMRLWVSSKDAAQVARFDAVYRDGKRTASDLSGGIKSSSIPAEFAERYSHQRTSDSVLRSYVRANILPQTFLRERPRFVLPKDSGGSKESGITKADLAGEPLVRLGRSGGVVDYVFGEPTPVDASKDLPGVWIEQDAFVLRRLRFPSNTEFTYDQYGLQAGSIRLPQQRTIKWDDHTAIIRLISVKSVDPKTASAALNPTSITAPEAKAAKLPDQTQVKEFYTRFR